MKKTVTLLLLGALSLNAQDIYATFNVKPLKEATLAFTSGGTVTSINVDIGSKVSKGELLATLDGSEQEAALKLAQNDAINAKIKAQLNTNSFERYSKVKDIMDEEKFEQIDFAKQMSDVNAKKAQRSVQLRQAQLNKTRLKAPFTGVITAKYREIGDAVSGAQPQAFFQIMDMSSVKLVVTFDEKYINEVKQGDSFLYYVDGTKEEQMGTISKVYPTANMKTRKVTAEVVTKNLVPGLFGSGTIKAK